TLASNRSRNSSLIIPIQMNGNITCKDSNSTYVSRMETPIRTKENFMQRIGTSTQRPARFAWSLPFLIRETVYDRASLGRCGRESKLQKALWAFPDKQ